MSEKPIRDTTRIFTLQPTQWFPHPNRDLYFGGFISENQIVIYKIFNGAPIPLYYYLNGKNRKLYFAENCFGQQSYVVDSYNHTENTIFVRYAESSN